MVVQVKQVAKRASTSFYLGEVDSHQCVFWDVFISLTLHVFLVLCGMMQCDSLFFPLGSKSEGVTLMLASDYVPFAALILFLKFYFEVVWAKKFTYGLV